MKLSKTFLAILTTGILSCGLFSQQTQATPINGNINFGGSVKFNTLSLMTATTVTDWINAHVEAGGTGDFAAIPLNTAVTFNAPWTFSPSTPTSGLWSVAGFTFDLLSSSVTSRSASSLTVEGTGTVSGNGFDPTQMTWAFTTQNAGGHPRSIFSFSANGNAVPDGGSAVALLGLALTGLGFLRKKVLVG